MRLFKLDKNDIKFDTSQNEYKNVVFTLPSSWNVEKREWKDPYSFILSVSWPDGLAPTSDDAACP